MENRKALTAAQIRYLLTMKQLDGGGNGVRGAKVAAVLGFTSPSVHTMLNTFREMNLIRKNAYGVAYFTENGRDIVARYSRYYQAAFGLLSAHFPPDEHLRTAVYALLAELPETSLAQFCPGSPRPAGLRSPPSGGDPSHRPPNDEQKGNGL